MTASTETDLVENLTTLKHIAETLNRAVDVRGVLNSALARLIELMGLRTGWIILKDPAAQDGGYVLAAHHHLPPALEADNADAWGMACTCQDLCNQGKLTQAYNEVRCSRLATVPGDRRGLAVHASTPLRSGDRVLGILNVAAPDWSSFSPQALALLSDVGSQMGVALERARLFDRLQEQRLHEQSVLLDFSNQLLSHPDLDDLMDYLVEEVQRLLGADACALLLPGEEPGFFDVRAVRGWLGNPLAERQRIPGNGRHGLGLALHDQRPWLVEDLEESGMASAVPGWLRAEGFRGHAVMPLIAEGHPVGALMINMRQPRLLDEDEVRLLRLMANQSAIAIETACLRQEEVEREQLEKELALGRQIQLSLLPATSPDIPGWEYASFYQAAHQVGGDFYDFFQVPGEPDGLGMVIADVTGKGVPAALFMALGHTLIRSSASTVQSPSAALVQANRLILEHSRSDLFLTAFYAVMDTRTGHVVHANAGHPRPLWWQAATGRLQSLGGRGIALGVLGEIELEECESDVAPGDLLVFYTDGVTEAMDADKQQFGLERLQTAVTASPAASAKQVLEKVVGSVQAFVGDVPQSDDLTLFVVRRCP